MQATFRIISYRSCKSFTVIGELLNHYFSKACLLVESQSELYIFTLSGLKIFLTTEQHSLNLLKNQ